MNKVFLPLALAATILACEKDPIDIDPPVDMMIVTPEPPKEEPMAPTMTATPTVETGTATPIGVDNTPKPNDNEMDSTTSSDTTIVDIPQTSVLGEGEYIDESVVAPAGTTYLRSHFDGKDSRSHFYEVDEDVILVYVNDSPHPNEGTKHWYFGGISRVFSVDIALDFVVYRPEFITTTHRGIEIKHLANETPRLSELDRALDLAGDNWESDVIYQYDNLASIGGFAGLARNREFIVSIGGFETHVLLHENGHNYDFEHEDYMDQMTAIYPEGGFLNYYTSEVAEFRAEMFARYYLYRADMPAIVRNLLDILLN